MKAREKILLVVPCIGMKMNSNLAGWCMDLAKLDPTRVYSVAILNEAKPVDYARNYACAQFLSGDWNRLLMIDNDTVPPKDGELFQKFMDVDADVVVGQVPVWVPEVDGQQTGTIVLNAYKFIGEKDKYRSINPKIEPTVEEVDGGGTAFMVIRKKVIEDERLRFHDGYTEILGTEKVLGKDEPPPIFRVLQKPNGQWIVGEDLYFCFRVKNLGYSLKTYGLRCGHFKESDLMEHLKINSAMYEKGYAAASQAKEKVA